MEQKTIGQLIVQNQNTRPTTNYADRRQSTLQAVSPKGIAIRKKFGSNKDFLQKVNPDVQVCFAKNEQAAVVGDYPTLTDINAVYGDGFASDWLLPQIQNLASYTGAKNLTLKQEIELARVIATEYHHLKITEILLFFYRFKSGHYGRFYGSVDPIAITCALRDFIQERNAIIAAYDQEKRERNELEDRSKGPTLSLEQYKALKQEQNEELHHLKTIRPFIKIYESQ